MFAIDEHRDEITEIVRRAGNRSLDWFRRPVTVENKRVDGDFDPVTEADRVVEDEIRSALMERFPDHAVMGEERGESGSGRYRWVIDPIDGTRAFVSGQPMWGTLLGFEVDGVPVAGWMHQPVLDETHVATPAGGLLIRNGTTTPLVTRSGVGLSDAIVMCTHPDMFAPGPEQEGFARLDAATRLVRYSGDCVNYGLLAAGHVDLVVENQLAPYDIIPLIPIVESAGAVITDLDGKPPLGGGYVVAAGSVELHEAALAVLTDAR